MTLAPKHSGSVSYEAPVEQGPSPLAAVGELLTGMAANTLSSRSGPTEADRKQAALAPLAARLQDIEDMNINDSEKQTLARGLARDSLVTHGQYQSDIKAMLGNYGYEIAPTREVDLGDAQNAALNEFAATPEGQAAMYRSMVFNDDGSTNTQATMERFRVAAMENGVAKARLDSVSRELATVEADSGLYRAKSGKAWDRVAGDWAKGASDAVVGLMNIASQRGVEMDSLDEQLNFLRMQRQGYVTSVRAQALAAGIDPGVIDERINQVVKPFDNLIETLTNSAGDQALILEAFRNATKLELETAMVDSLGIISANPDYQKAVGTFMAQRMFDQQGAEGMLEVITENGRKDRTRSLNFFPDIPATGLGDSAGEGAMTRPEQVQDFRVRQRENPKYLSSQAGVAGGEIGGSDITTPGGRDMVLHGVGIMATVSEAHQGPLGRQMINNFFTPENVDKMNKMVKEGGQTGVQLRSALNNLMAQQMRYQMSVMESAEADVQFGVKFDGKQFNLTWADTGEVITGNTATVSGNGKAMMEAVRNMNTLLAVSRSIDPKLGKSITAVGESLRVTGEISPTAVEQFSEDEITLDQITNIEHTSSANVGMEGTQALVPMIDRTEGGGRYDTLFGHSQKAGGQFAGVDVTKMTIGQVLQFSDPEGQYGQWVKGQVGRVATPMGRYQFVGTTLRATANEMGLPSDTLFTPEVQDAMFDFKVRQRLASADSMQGKIGALRSEWEGFKNVDDQALANAISQIEGTEPIVLAHIPRGGGEDLYAGAGITDKAMASLAAFGGDAVRPYNPRTGGGVMGSGGGSSAADLEQGKDGARAQELDSLAIARLKSAGITDVDGIPRFNSNSEMAAALEQGAIQSGDVVIVQGQPMRAL